MTCPAGRRREKGSPAAVFTKLTSQVAKSTFAARVDGWWLLLYTSLQDRRCTHQAAPWQKGPWRAALALGHV